ncbi:MAG: amidohydrolase family protein [bacterium]|nr:amidohydrolase family protein [bacterium]
MKRFTSLVVAVLTAFAVMYAMPQAKAMDEIPSEVTLIKNVNVWDGKSENLKEGYDVLIVRNMIKKVAKDIPASGTYEVDVKRDKVSSMSAPSDYRTYTIHTISEEGGIEKKSVKINVIDGGGKTLMPGLIDMHTHVSLPIGIAEMRDVYDDMTAGAMAGQNMRKYYLMRGFTTVRDIGGASAGIAKAIKEGVLVGPRMYSAGAVISQTSGHGDWGTKTALLGDAGPMQDRGDTIVADGVPEVLKAARTNLRRGAAQLKIMAGGGVASDFDPLESLQYTSEEIQAAVKVAESYGTYVASHGFTDHSVNHALNNGVRSIEHGHTMKEETVKRLSTMDNVVFSVQAYVGEILFQKPEEISFFTADHVRKGKAVHEGANQVFGWLKKYKVFCIGGSDMYGADQLPLAMEDIIVREKWWAPFEALQQNTYNAGIVLKWSGPMDPYKDGTLGTIEEGGYADMLIIDGNPLEGLKVLRDEKNMQLIMKDGIVYKNTL